MMVERAVPGEAEWAMLSAPHVARYLAAGEYAAGCRVLDAGSGAGYGASLLKAAGAAEVLGVDLDRETVRQAQARFGEASVEFVVDDCEELGRVIGPFELICCFEAIEHLTHPERFLRRAGQLLTEDGALMVSTPDRASTPPFVDGRPRNRFHVFEWYRQEFQNMLAAHFSEVEMRVQVESPALRSRLEAVQALREGLMWSNPLLTFVWRKWPFSQKPDRSWTKLAGLAAPTITDYPIVRPAVVAAYGKPCFNVAICRRPIK